MLGLSSWAGEMLERGHCRHPGFAGQIPMCTEGRRPAGTGLRSNGRPGNQQRGQPPLRHAHPDQTSLSLRTVSVTVFFHPKHTDSLVSKVWVAFIMILG